MADDRSSRVCRARPRVLATRTAGPLLLAGGVGADRRADDRLCRCRSSSSRRRSMGRKWSRPRGAGPAFFSPTRLYFEPWHGHSNHCDDCAERHAAPEVHAALVQRDDAELHAVDHGRVLVDLLGLRRVASSVGYCSMYVRALRRRSTACGSRRCRPGCRAIDLSTFTLPPKPAERNGHKNASIAGANPASRKPDRR